MPHIDVLVRIDREPGKGHITMTKPNGEVEEFPLTTDAGIDFMGWLAALMDHCPECAHDF